jgi:prepilin signal peptidase PulO-like enzyme (type II secretory pathway)
MIDDTARQTIEMVKKMPFFAGQTGQKLLCGFISVVLFSISIATQVGVFPALCTAAYLLIGAKVIALSLNFARRTVSRSFEDFMRLQLWASAVLAVSLLPMHLFGVLFGKDGGMFIPETGVTAIATIIASGAGATCLTRWFKAMLEGYHRYMSRTVWFLTFSVLNLVLMLPSVFSFIAKL